MPPKTTERSTKRKSPPAALVTPKQTKKKATEVTGKDLVRAFKHIKDGAPSLANKWFSAEQWVSILPEFWNTLKGREDECSARKLTRQVNQIASEHYDSKSPSGIYRNYYGKRQQWYYLFTAEERCPSPPTQVSFCFSNIRDFLDVAPDINNNNNNNNTNNNNISSSSEQKRSDAIRNESTFAQKETFKKFMPVDCVFESYINPEKAVRERLAQTMEICMNGMSNWYEAVQGAKEDTEISLHYQKYIEMKCLYLWNAIGRALDENAGMESGTTWTECCQHAINKLKEAGFAYIDCERTVRNWFNQIQNNEEARFPHPDPQIASGEVEVAIPPFFVEFPEALQAFYNHADALADKDELSCEAMFEFVNNTLIPHLVKKHNKDLPEAEQITPVNFLLGLNFLRRKSKRIRATENNEEGEADDNGEAEDEDDTLEPTICRRTINNWMTQLGYGWKRRTKSSYNSTHEHPITKAYRADFILRYFYKYEPRAHRWVQVAKVDADRMRQNKNVPNDAGIAYTTTNGNEMVEFHVDDCQSFGIIMDNSTIFGGELSVLFLNVKTSLLEGDAMKDLLETDIGNYKYELDGESYTEIHASQFKDPNGNAVKQFMNANNLVYDKSVRVPLIMWGQDECIFKQYITFMHHWVKRDGQQPMTPKDDGLGLMVSAIKSREFGFGFQALDEDQLNVVNQFRRTKRPQYRDKKAATQTNGNADKKDLDKSPFLVIFDYGTSAEGYWNYNKMCLQLEDCIDVLDALFSIPTDEVDDDARLQHMPDVPHVDGLKRRYDHVFLFDHSCGHDRKQEDGLSTKDVRVNPTAMGRHMRDSTIEKKSGYLGDYKYNDTLKVGDVQKMVFGELDNFGNAETGPVLGNMPKDDEISGTTEEKLNVKELAAALEARGFNSKGRKADLVKRCESAGIPTARIVPKVVKPGWLGKAKGALQILYERGWINKEKLADYSRKGKKDELGNYIKETSLDYLMGQLEDFANERTMLQMIGEDLGCIIDRTPKCTPEIAGEGIEYDWAMAKMYYRKQPLSRKRSKDAFEHLVKECMGKEVLSLVRTRKFSRRARQYMTCYYMLEKDGESTTPLDVKKYKKQRKSHTDVLKEETGYISECLRQLGSS